MMPPVEDLGLVSRTATDNQASVWTQESFEHDCPPGDRSPVVDNDWRFDNLCGSHLQSHLQNLPKTAIAPPQQFGSPGACSGSKIPRVYRPLHIKHPSSKIVCGQQPFAIAKCPGQFFPHPASSLDQNLRKMIPV